MASNAPVPSRAPLDSMQRLSPIVSLHRPEGAPDPSAPKLIALFTWMGAQEPHVAKYITGYQSLYPSSSILVIRCPMENVVLRDKPRRDVGPAVSALRSILPEGSEGPGEVPEMILHLFSNGGCVMFQHFMNVLRDAAGEGKESGRLPRHVCVMDSCPGSFDWMRAHKALSAGFPAWVSPFVHLIVLFHLVTSLVSEPVGVKGGRWGLVLNEAGVLSVQERRVYLYADGDEMVDPRHVEKHAEEAKEGLDGAVKTLNFGASRHVAHARTDPERYWGAVKGVWEGS